MKLAKVLRAGLLGLGMAMAVVPATSGCQAMKEGLENAMGVRDDIKQEFGVEASVNINVSNGKQTVKVELNEMPEGDAKETKAKITEMVKKRFPDADEVVIRM